MKGAQAVEYDQIHVGIDTNPSCATWAAHGECAKNAKYMQTFCPTSCAPHFPSFS